ncbi:MAG: hypothetical protein HC902_04470 [Calothrix sp. SM1_5_4]|nr:hypothetical protein [Calothrix sp. SM1_5_4]
MKLSSQALPERAKHLTVVQATLKEEKRKDVTGMKFLIYAMILCSVLPALASDDEARKLKFNYRNADLLKVLEDYSQASGQKFVISPDARGKVTIINREPVDLKEAFNQLSTAMAPMASVFPPKTA